MIEIVLDAIFSEMSFDLQTDKEFSVNGKITRDYLPGKILAKPRLGTSVLKDIFLGGSHTNLKPERRLDASLYFEADRYF